MAEKPDQNNEPAQQTDEQGESFYDASFSIEAMQHEPYDDGFTWRTILGAFFVAFVMLPGVIFMGLMIGQDLGTAAEWVTIILFVEIARRSFVTLRKQELYILKYTVSSLTHIMGGLALGGGVFAMLVWQRYLRNSEAFSNFGIAHQVPDWFAPYGDVAYQQGFLGPAWQPVVAVIVSAMTLSKLTELSLGFLAYKLTADVERLPFPLAPVHAEGAIALAERSQEQRKKGFRQYCFAVGIVGGALFGIFYMAIPILSKAFLDEPLQLIPIPFWDLTQDLNHIFPAAAIAISMNLALVLVGCVLPWRIVLGMVGSAVLVHLVVNPFFLQPAGYLPHWDSQMDAVQTHVSNTVDLYLSVSIGVSFAVFAFGLVGVIRALSRARRKDQPETASVRGLIRRDKPRGDPPTWLAVLVWMIASVGFVVLTNHLVNSNIPEGEKGFSVYWLIGFAFIWTPINTYINARMSGIAGQYAGVPFVMETAIFTSGYKYVDIWFAPLPLHNFGGMADKLRICQLTRTKFTSIFKAELLVFPLMLIASFIFWSYINSLGPIPSESYPFAQKFWPQHAQMKALWASSMQEGSLMFEQSLRPWVIGGTFGGVCTFFILSAIFGFSTQYVYGAIATLTGRFDRAVPLLIGALLGRFYFARKFGREKWTNFAPILAVGFSAGMGLTGMLAIAIYFLWVSIGTGY
ncbi:MAG: hypothetical protein ACLFVW_00150 [Phycisphaerae bacterium]